MSSINSSSSGTRRPSASSTSTTTTTVVIDTDEIMDEIASAIRSSTKKASEGSGRGGGREGVEGVYKSTQVYQHSPPSAQAIARAVPRKKKRRSRVGREGDTLLRSLVTLTSRTTNGVCRAVNVTGTAASVVTGGFFKLAGAAVLDTVDGIEYASGMAPAEVPVITEVYRFVTKGLRKTGETVYDFGVAAQNMTAEATEAAEETIRNVVETVLETTTGSDGGDESRSTRTRDYFSDQEDRIVDNMVFGMSSAVGDDDDEGGAPGGGLGNDPDSMGYSEIDLSAQFGRDAARGRHADADVEWESRGGRVRQQQQYEQGSPSALLLALHPAGEAERRPKMLALVARARLAVRRSILRTSRAVPSMRFPQMVACGMVFACRAVTTNPWCSAASFVGARMYLKFVESIYLECLKERMMSDIKFEAVARLHEGSPERARWFNTAAGAMWVPMLEPFLSRWVSRQITAGIERSLPSNVSWVGLGKVTLGPEPPKIRYVQVQNVTALAARKSMGQSNAVIDSVLLEAGQPGGDVNGEHVVYLELGVDWTSYRSKVSLKLGEQSRRRNWWSVSSYVPSYRVKVCDLGIKAKVVLALAIGEGRPFVKQLWVGFAEPPLTHLSLEALTGMDIANLPVLRKHLRHVVMRCVMPLTEPRHLSIQMKPPAPPPPSYRGAALAARVRPAAAGVRKGVLSRIPGFGIRQLMRNRAAAAAREGERSGDEDGDGDDGPQRQLEAATKRLLVEFGGDYREETVLAAAEVSKDTDEAPLAPVRKLSPEPSSQRGRVEPSRKETEPESKPKAKAKGNGMAKGAGKGKAKPKAKAKVMRPVEPEAAAAAPVEQEGGMEERMEKGPEEARSMEHGTVPNEKEAEFNRELKANPGARQRANKRKLENPKPQPEPRSEIENLDGANGRGEKKANAGEAAEGGERVEESSLVKGERPASGKGESAETALSEATPAAKDPAAIAASATASALETPESTPCAMSVLPLADKSTACTTEVAARRGRNEEVREHRAEIKRRRAALREQRGTLSAAPPADRRSAIGFVRRWWGRGPAKRGRRSRKPGPEREEMIRRVCALSRPPPGDR